MAQRGKGESVIAHPTDHVLRLPQLSTLDTPACMQGINPTPSNQVRAGSGRGIRPFHRGAEQQLETRFDGTELLRWEERKVDLQRAWEQEDAVNCRADVHVDVV